MEILQRIIAAIVSFFMTLAAFFGIPVKTPEPEKTVQNVIYMIGDGMGVNHLEKTKLERGAELVMDSMPEQGFAMTYSATDETTDSAAAATALACGVKTYNGAVGLYWYEAPDTVYSQDEYPVNLTTVCAEAGMTTGVITTDCTTGATPGGFTAHTQSRSDGEKILADQLASPFDLIWGAQGDFTETDDITAAGFTFVYDVATMCALAPGERSFGRFSGKPYKTDDADETTASLSQMTEKAIMLLDEAASAREEDCGFFLVVEGAHIDKKSHDNDSEGMTDALIEFDNAVAKALEFAELDGHTLVVVTADHETGGIVLNSDGGYSFTKGAHSSANVPVRAYGPISFIENGEVIENTEIPKRIAAALELSGESFPAGRAF